MTDGRIKQWLKADLLKLPELPMAAVDEVLQEVDGYIEGYIHKHDRRRPSGPLTLCEYEAGRRKYARRITDKPTRGRDD